MLGAKKLPKGHDGRQSGLQVWTTTDKTKKPDTAVSDKKLLSLQAYRPLIVIDYLRIL